MSKFPDSGNLSLTTVANALGANPKNFNNLVGKTLWNLDGTTYSVPSFGTGGTTLSL
jgi:hypothetical protein